MSSAIVFAAFRIAVIGARKQSLSGGVAILLVSNCAERHAFLPARALIQENGIILLAPRLRPSKLQESVFSRVVYNHFPNVHKEQLYIIKTR